MLDINREGQAVGGLVIEPEMGLHENVVVVDFKSLYPTIINTFKIDPLSNLLKDTNPEVRHPQDINFQGLNIFFLNSLLNC